MPIFEKRKQVVQMFDVETKEPIDMENSPEDKAYLIIISDYDGDPDSGRWVKIRGRQSVAAYLCSEVFNSVDPIHSYILTGKIPLGYEVSVYTFLRYCKETGKAEVNITVDDLNAYISEYDPKVDLNKLYYEELNAQIKK